MMRRIIVLLAAAVLGAAAPARAWCEASCLTPAHETATPHCPSHEPAGSGATISSSALDECPALDSARPTVPARLDAQAVAAVAPAPGHGARSRFVPSPVRPHSTTSVFERCTPLRI